MTGVKLDFQGLPILVVGDVMLDHYITGEASRVSPEAPVPVVSKKHEWVVPGGAANVARGLARLGCQARLVGLVGRDSAGETLRRELRADGIDAGLAVSPSRPTICKTRIMARGQQLLRVDEETIQRPSLEEMVALRRNVEMLLAGCHAIILSDYAKGVLLRDKKGHSLCHNVVDWAKSARIPVLVDPKGMDWERYEGAKCVTPNSAEFKKICESLPQSRHHVGNLEDEPLLRNELANALCLRLDLDRLLLTRGPRGMDLYAPGQRPVRIRAQAREVADVSGAGDTVIATLAACVASGLDWAQSAAIANTAAGIAVGKTGTAPVSLAEIKNALRAGNESSKLHGRDEMRERAAEWRRQGQKVVFTNGCFDLLHPGHISLLRQSAAMGDKLVVGLNSDASVKRLKGPERPIQTEQSRAQLLSAIGDVDAVVIFDEDTPEALIHEIRPDVLVKGSDYTIDKVIGADFVQSYGGRVCLVEIVAGHSTTNLALKMRGGEDATYSDG